MSEQLESLSVDKEFEEKVISALNEELDESRVKQNFDKKSYLEGYDIINKANEVFGPLNWSMATVKLEVTEHGAHAIVNVELYMPNGRTISRSGTGYNAFAGSRNGKSEDTAIKGAETDAMKRAFRTFGTQFGNSLYDKSRPGAMGSTSSKPNYSKPQSYNKSAPSGGTSGWGAKWPLKFGPGKDKTLPEMEDEVLRWYWDKAKEDVSNGSFVERNEAMIKMIEDIQPDIAVVDPIRFGK